MQVFTSGNFDDRPYIVMELLDGADLSSVVERSGRLDSLAAAYAALSPGLGFFGGSLRSRPSEQLRDDAEHADQEDIRE